MKNTIENNLKSIFDKYQESFENKELNEIVSREFVYSNVNRKSDVLICGINPSYRKSENKDKFYGFNFNELTNDRYFKKFHELFSSFANLSRDYIDLFYQRHTSQKKIFSFYKESKGIEFLVEQLEFTQVLLEDIKPKVIFVFNRQAATYFGRNIENTKEGLKEVWMGYEFEETEIKDFVRITGLVDSESRINQSISQSNLIGTYVYFSRFIDYRTPKADKEQVERDVKEIRKRYLVK